MADENIIYSDIAISSADTATGAPEEKSRTELINEKLTTAADVLTRADAENKLRRKNEISQKEESEKLNLAQLEEARLRREAELLQREAARQKREAELLYAENYRKKLKAEKERRAALAAARQKTREESLNGIAAVLDTNILQQDLTAPKAANTESKASPQPLQTNTGDATEPFKSDTPYDIAQKSEPCLQEFDEFFSNNSEVKKADTTKDCAMCDNTGISERQESFTTDKNSSYILTTDEILSSDSNGDEMVLNIEGVSFTHTSGKPVYGFDTPFSSAPQGDSSAQTNSVRVGAAALDARIASLKRELNNTETAYRTEIAKLQNNEQLARRNALEYELMQKETLYSNEIAALTARLAEMEQTHLSAKEGIAARAAIYENPYASYTPSTSREQYYSTYADTPFINEYGDIAAKGYTNEQLANEYGSMYAKGYTNEQLANEYGNAYAESLAKEQLANEYGDISYTDGYLRKTTSDEYANPSYSAYDTAEDAAYSQAEAEALAHMNKRDLKRHISKSVRLEEKLLKKRKRLLKKMPSLSSDALSRLYVEYLAVSRELIESYISNYIATLTLNDRKNSRKYRRLIDSEVVLYNSDTERYGLLTGFPVRKVSETLASDIAAGNYAYSIPEVIYRPAQREAFSEFPTESEMPSKRDIIDEQLRFLKDEEMREAEIDTDDEYEEYSPSENIFTQIKANNDTVNARITYRISKLADNIAVTRFKYGEKTPKEKRAEKSAVRLLRAMKSDKKLLTRATEKNNLRYLKVAEYDIDGAKLPRRADKKRMTLLKERLIALLAQRDEVNAKLLALYNENEKNGKKSAKNMRKKYSDIRLKATKKAYKKQHGTYSKVNRLRVSLKEKQKIYDVMNTRTELTAYLAECEYRLKHERPRRAAKRTLVSEIRSTRKNIRYADKDIRVMVKKATKRSGKRPVPVVQLAWLLVLILLIGAGVLCYLYREPLFAWVMSLISSMKG